MAFSPVNTIIDFLEPVDISVISNDEGYNPNQLGSNIDIYTSDFPDVKAADLIIVGCSEARGAGVAKKDDDGINAVRTHFYNLYQWHTDVKVADIGNMKSGATLEDSYSALQQVLSECSALGKKVVVIGGTHDIMLAQYNVFATQKKIMEAVCVDAFLDMNIDSRMPAENFLMGMFTGEPNYLKHYNHIGFQSYFVHPSMLETIDKLRFDCYRVGVVKEHMETMEPVVRNAHIFGFDITAIQSSHAPANRITPNGFNGEEACMLMQQKKTQTNDTDMLQMLKQKMFVKVFANNYKIFIGEPIMVTYKFYVAMNMHNRPSVTKQPEFSGWSVKELQFDQGPEFENINNEPYSVYTIRKVQLTPLQEGNLSLGKAHVNNQVEIFNAESPYVPQKFSINVSNVDMAVEVSNLPEKNKPENFYGITGVFNIKAAASKNKIPVGENGHLMITIKGAGNLEAIVEPEVTWPRSTEHFDGKDSQHVNQDNFPVSGDRVFDIPFIGKNEGIVTIPPIKFSFFNTVSKDYQTVTTDSIPVTFTSAIADRNEIAEVVEYDISNRKYDNRFSFDEFKIYMVSK